MPRLPKHNDAALIEALVRYVNITLPKDEARIERQARTFSPDPPLSVLNAKSKDLFAYIIGNDEIFHAAIDRPNCPRSFAAALKRIYKPLRERGVILTLRGGGLVTLEKE